MQRVPEPEIMEADDQVQAYAQADFEEPHNHFIDLFRQRFPEINPSEVVLDLGCGPADISIRFARAFPGCRLHGVDASPAMLKYGTLAIKEKGLMNRIKLYSAHLPKDDLPFRGYGIVISNSLLHHLEDPLTLWRTIRDYAKDGGSIFVMDLMRPESKEQAEYLVKDYSGSEPDILKYDFCRSLLAAYRPDEVRGQLIRAELDYFSVEVVSDRHFIVHGYFQDNRL